MTRKVAVPTKGELLQLQKLYKTDEKIGERLGGVPAYLVAYWRRKKNIPKHSLPKFSEMEVRNLWERYGDDEKAGLELGLSKAAFYNWRRRYGIREKPAFLKLEQLEFAFPGATLSAHANSLYGKQSVAQKILARAAGVERAEVGESIDVEPDLAVSHREIGEVVQRFKKLGAVYVWNPNKIVITEDYLGSGESPAPIIEPKVIHEFVKRQRIKGVYDLREGLSQQVVIENGHILPGELVVAVGTNAGAFGCLGSHSASLTPELVAQLWAAGKTTLRVPPTIRIVVGGRKGRGVYVRDILMAIKRKIGAAAAAGAVIEYSGSVISQTTLSERITLSSLANEVGAVGAIAPYDSTTRRYLTGRGPGNYKPIIPDKNAEYASIFQINIDQVVPQIACPMPADTIKDVAELEGTSIQLVILGSLANGRFDDLRIAADILKGKQVHADCRLLIVPASRAVYLEALKKGLIRVFVEAGAVIVSSGSFDERSLAGSLAGGERGLTTFGSEIAAQTGATGAEFYLCSPATAAVSALNASITDPTRFVR